MFHFFGPYNSRNKLVIDCSGCDYIYMAAFFCLLSVEITCDRSDVPVCCGVIYEVRRAVICCNARRVDDAVAFFEMGEGSLRQEDDAVDVGFECLPYLLLRNVQEIRSRILHAC